MTEAENDARDRVRIFWRLRRSGEVGSFPRPLSARAAADCVDRLSQDWSDEFDIWTEPEDV